MDSQSEHPVDVEDAGIEELERLVMEALDSGEPIEAGPEYWREKHRRLEEQMRRRRER